MTQAQAKLPLQQFLVLAICRFAEPVLTTSVFPYLPEMMRFLGVRENEVAKWVGWTSATFSLCQCITAVPWGSLSDRVGRKPIVLTGLSVTMFFSLLFGFSTSLPMAIFARACLGLGNGNVGILRTMVAELVPEKKLQPRAFSIMPLVFSIGSIFGPALGGALAEPARKRPDIFTSSFWKRFPFALPNMVIGLFFVTSWMTGALFLKETLPSKRSRHDPGIMLGEKLTTCCVPSKRKPSKSDGDSEEPTERSPLFKRGSTPDDEEAREPQTSVPPKPKRKVPWSEILTPQSKLVLVAYMSFALHSLAFDALIPVFLDYPKDQSVHSTQHSLLKFFGGFGMDSGSIGMVYTVQGMVGITMQLFFFPPIAHYFGVLTCFRFSASLLPLVYFLIPLTALYADHTVGYIGIFTLMACKLLANLFYFPCCTILLTNSAPNVEVLGTLNGLATSVSGIGRGLGPACVGWIFSLGAELGYIVLPWWSMSFLALISCWACFKVKEGKGLQASSGEESS